jgi:hemolysin III
MSTTATDTGSEAPRYSRGEEMANAASHGVGIAFALAALVLMLVRSLARGDALEILAVTLFGLGLVILFSASTIYHAVSQPGKKRRLRVFDHASIYLLIAGTYSPFCLVFLKGRLGWTIFAAVWGLAIFGLVLAFFFTGKNKILATASYVALGWIIVFAFAPLRAAIPPESFSLLLAGGAAYTIGAVIYAVKRLPWNHPIWHLFVLAGAVCHFVSVFIALPR